MKSFYESSARQRIEELLDINTFVEYFPPENKFVSPHLELLDLPVSYDDGVVIGKGKLKGMEVFISSEEGSFMGGSVGEIHGAKVVGLMQKAIIEKPKAVILIIDSGGVRLHEANAGLIAVSEIMRVVFDVRDAGIPVIVLIGGPNGCFGGMSIVACCANAIIISEDGRLGMSGPEVIETAHGVEEFDSHDKALVWRTTGGKHRYLMGDSHYIVSDLISAFRETTEKAIHTELKNGTKITQEKVEKEQKMLEDRLNIFGMYTDSLEIWKQMKFPEPAKIPIMLVELFVEQADQIRKEGLT